MKHVLLSAAYAQTSCLCSRRQAKKLAQQVQSVHAMHCCLAQMPHTAAFYTDLALLQFACREGFLTQINEQEAMPETVCMLCVAALQAGQHALQSTGSQLSRQASLAK